MFCEKCGAANDAGAKFCAFCGNAMESEEIVAAPEKSLPVTPYAKWILLGAAAVVVVLLLAIFGAFKPGAVRVVEKYTKGTIRANAGDVYKAIDLPYTRDEDMDKEDIRDIIEGMQERLEEIKEERKYDGIRVSVKSVKRTKKYSRAEVRAVEEYLYDYYGYDVDEYPLQGLACVQVKTVEKQDGDTDTMREDIMTAKVGSKWYIIRTLSKSEVKDVIEEAE